MLQLIRSSRTSLRFSNKCKLTQLKTILDEYQRVVNSIIDSLWGKPIPKYLPQDSEIDSWISARLKQCAYKQSTQILKSVKKRQLKGKKVSKPRLTKQVMELDERFISIIEEPNKTFDGFMQVSSLGDKIIIKLPFKKHRHILQLESEGFQRKKSVRILFEDNRYFVDFFYSKDIEENPSKKLVGCDMGIKKLLVTSDGHYLGEGLEPLIRKIKRKKQNSKAYKRALKERDQYINRVVRELPDSHIVMEDLTGIVQGTRKRLNKEFRKTISRWTYSQVMSRIENHCARKGFLVHKVDPSYTSQTCSKCGFVHRSNRNGEVFRCTKCGYTSDADYNASLNILTRFISSQNMVGRRKKTKTKDECNTCLCF